VAFRNRSKGFSRQSCVFIFVNEGNELNYPARLTVVESGIFLDGGSIRVEVMDGKGLIHPIFLDRSFISQDTHTTQLYVNKIPVIKRSEEEILWLELLRRADFRTTAGGTLESLLLFPFHPEEEDIAELYRNPASHPDQMMRLCVFELLDHIESPAYAEAPRLAVVQM
jgi:hypothetical protein